MPFLDEQGLQRLWENIVAEVDSKTQGYPPIYKEDSVVTFDSLKGLGINATSIIEPTQAGTGEASPDNVRAIGGYNDITLQNAGKNLIPLPYENGTKTSRGITFTLNNDGTITANGTATENASFHITTRMYLPAGEYRISGGLRNNARIVANKYNVNGKELSGAADTSGKGATLTLTENTRLHIYIVIIAGETVNNEVFKPQLEAGTTTTEYEQSKYNSVEVELNNTIYGGSYDWKTGKLTVTHHRIVFDGTTEGAKMDGTDNAGATYAYILSTNIPKPLKWHSKAYANKLKSVGTSTVISLSMGALAGTTETDSIQTIVSKYNTLLKQWYDAGEPLEVVYELETPETYDLTPYEFETIEGLNTVWSNCGPTKGIFNTFVTDVTEKELSEAIEDIKIGGRNLLTKRPTTSTHLSSNITRMDYGFTIAPVDQDTFVNVTTYEDIIQGEEYTLSMECEGFGEDEEWTFYIFGQWGMDFTLKNGKVSYTFKSPGNMGKNISLDDKTREKMPSGTVTVKNLKLEKGNKATDWSPCPDDVDAAIAEASETVKTTALTPSSKTKYYPTLSDNAATETDSLIKNSSISVNLQNGTTSAAGVAQLILGNGTATGTAGNMTGYITLYAANGSDHRIYPNDNGVSCVHTLPPSGGTLVSGSNYAAVIPAATTSKAGLLSAADKQKLDELVSGGDSGESTITYVTAGKGLTGGGASGNVTLNIGAGSGISVADDSISVNTNYITSGKNYKVQVDSTSGGLFVNVPWTDNNTTYVNATQSAAGLMSAADKVKLDDNVVLKMSGDGTYGYVSYRGLTTKYFGGTTVPYIRIALPCSTSWGMFTMRVLMRENYSTGASGEILIYGNHSSSDNWNTFNATCIGNLTSNVKVYGSDKKYFYIACGSSYSGVSVEEMLVGDSATSYDLRNITIDYVSELPATHQTATMYYTLSVGSDKVVAVNQGGTGATTAAAALTNLGAVATNGTGATGTWGISVTGSAGSVAWSNVTSKTNATQSAAGLMSAADKTKLDGIAANANNYTYTLPTASSSTLGGVKIGTGIAISSGVISNSGVRSVSTGSTNGTISVNTNGSSADVAVKGLGTAAYAASTSFAPATHTHDTYLPYSGGTLTGSLSTSATVPVSGKYFRNIDIQAASTSSIVAGSSLATGTILIKYQ